MCAGIVDVSVQFLHPLLLIGEEVIKFLLLHQRKRKVHFLDLSELLVEFLDFFSEMVEHLLERIVGIVS